MELHSVNKKGEQQTTKTTLQSWAKLTPAQVDQLLSNVEAAKAAPDPTMLPPGSTTTEPNAQAQSPGENTPPPPAA